MSRKYPLQIKAKAIALRQSGKPIAIIYDEILNEFGVSIPKSTITDWFHQVGLTLNTETALVNNSKSKRKFSDEQINTALDLRRKGVKIKEITLITGMKESVLRFYFKKNSIKKNSSVTEQELIKIKELRDVGVTTEEIAQKIGLTKNQVNYRSNSVLGISTTPEYSEEIQNKIIDLRKQNISILAISDQLALKPNTVSYFCQKAGIRWTPPAKKEKSKPIRKNHADEFYQLVDSENYAIHGEYTDAFTKIPATCPKGHKTHLQPSSFKLGARCWYCYRESRRGVPNSKNAKYTWQNVYDIAKELNHTVDLPPLNEKINMLYNLKIKCICGIIFQPIVYDYLRKNINHADVFTHIMKH